MGTVNASSNFRQTTREKMFLFFILPDVIAVNVFKCARLPMLILRALRPMTRYSQFFGKQNSGRTELVPLNEKFSVTFFLCCSLTAGREPD